MAARKPPKVPSRPEPADAVDFAAVFAAIPAASALFAADAPRFTVLAASDVLLAAAQRSREAIVGRPLAEAFPNASPGDPDARGLVELRASIEAAVRTGVPQRMDRQRYDLPRPDGEWETRHWDALNTPVRGPDGAVRYVLHQTEEVTERVRAEAALSESEQQLRTMADDVPRGEAERERLLRALEIERARLAAVFAQTPSVLAIVRGREHVLSMANEAYLALNGHRDVLGKPLLEAIPELRDQGFDRLLDAVVATGEPFVGREVPIRLSTSPGAPPEERFFDFVYLPLVEHDDSGAPRRVGVIAHGNDITGQVRARREVERLLGESERAHSDAEAARREAEAARAEAETARRVAEAASRAKSEFLAVMSHELRTPLNAIGGYAELLELGIHGPVTEAQRTALDRIQRSQRHLLGLIAGVLDYSRVEAGVVTYWLEDIPVTEAVAEAETLVAPQLRAKGLGYAWSGAAPGICVRADREKLQQILLNLLGNAIKFTNERDGEPGRIAVSCTVDARDAAGAGGRVHLRVRDSGEGIAPDALERIFEPFVQADQRLTRAHAGVGLGLAISRDLARGMGGDLSVASEVGVGSTFTLTLPRA